MCYDSMVYLNKVYSNLEVPSCPIVTEITTTPECFEQQLVFFDEREDKHNCGCGCHHSFYGNFGSSFNWGDNLTYNIESTEVLFTDFDIASPENLTAEDITVDGIPVDEVDYFNERYMVSTNELMTRISDCACMKKGLPTRAYLLLTNNCNWKARVTIVLRGEVSGCGICRRFKLIMKSKDNKNICIPANTTFATPSLCLPCTTNGISPIINFSFTANGTFLNPVIQKTPSDKGCELTLSGMLVTEPELRLQVTRQTLFKTDSEVVNVPCDDIEKCKRAFDCCTDDEGDHPYHLKDRCCVQEEYHDDECCGQRNEKQAVPHDRDIACQFNGYNGCRF